MVVKCSRASVAHQFDGCLVFRARPLCLSSVPRRSSLDVGGVRVIHVPSVAKTDIPKSSELTVKSAGPLKDMQRLCKVAKLQIKNIWTEIKFGKSIQIDDR